MNWIATNENRRRDIEQCSNADRKCDCHDNGVAMTAMIRMQMRTTGNIQYESGKGTYKMLATTWLEQVTGTFGNCNRPSLTTATSVSDETCTT